jgi:hypothetical protein
MKTKLNIKLYTILFFVILLIASSIVLYNSRFHRHEKFVDLESTKSADIEDTSFIQCVVARYNEDTDWFKDEPWNKMDMICYNKGPKLPENCFNDKCKVVELENVGRCDHTYLYHIIENYDSLAPVTFFLPASCMDGHKKQYTMKVLFHIINSHSTVLLGGKIDNVRDTFQNFTLDEWKATNSKNLQENPESYLQKSPIRPYGKWYDENFDKDIRVTVFTFYGIIAIAKEHIIQHPKARYQKLIKYVNSHSNPEAGHYMERSWGVMFYPYPESCVYYL